MNAGQRIILTLRMPYSCGLDWRCRVPSVCGQHGRGGRYGIWTVQGPSISSVPSYCSRNLPTILNPSSVAITPYHLLLSSLLLIALNLVLECTPNSYLLLLYYWFIYSIIPLFTYWFWYNLISSLFSSFHIHSTPSPPLSLSLTLTFNLPYSSLFTLILTVILTLCLPFIQTLVLSFTHTPLPNHAYPHHSSHLPSPSPSPFRLSIRQFRQTCRSTFLTIAFRAITLKRQRLCVRAAVRYHTRRVLSLLMRR